MERTIRLLSIEEASESLGISPSEAWRHVTDGKLTAMKIDERCLVSEMQVEFFKEFGGPRLSVG
jgi:hypothetical protein